MSIQRRSEAKRQLMIAAHLGTPAWRVTYHCGLFEEASGNFHLALQHYEEAIAANDEGGKWLWRGGMGSSRRLDRGKTPTPCPLMTIDSDGLRERKSRRLLSEQGPVR
ncbi:MAG: hypothetical protein LDL14_05245 [Nitrospira sp.]|nr:hypothetical protein [Nitrospira sp.]